MKILFVYQYCLLGGVTTQLVNRLDGLRQGWDVHFVFLGEYGGKKAFGDYKHIYIINNPEKFRQLVVAEDYDVISIIDTNEVYNWLARCNYKGLVINEVHTTTKNLEKLKFLKNEKQIHLMLTPSHYMKKVIEEEYGFGGHMPIEVMPNCVNLEKFYPVENEMGQEGPLILWVGKLDDHKRWYDFVEIAKKLEYEYRLKDAKYMMVGGITAKQEVVDRLMKQLYELDLLGKTTWYSAIGYDEMQEIYAKVYQSGGVYVSTTVNESFGMTVLEAMCMKVPLVVPRVGALVELCEPYGENIMYTPLSLSEASEKIMRQVGSKPQYDIAMYSTENVCQIFQKVILKYFNEFRIKRE
ncbi:MAG: glycosyltransferase family 4 protein [Cellulosilyticaceae bacterium]